MTFISKIYSRFRGYSLVHLSIFFQRTQHDNTSPLILPHHPPEVLHCVLPWPLSGYIGTAIVLPWCSIPSTNDFQFHQGIVSQVLNENHRFWQSKADKIRIALVTVRQPWKHREPRVLELSLFQWWKLIDWTRNEMMYSWLVLVMISHDNTS